MHQDRLSTGRRLTPQRRLVYETLAAVDTHPDAERLIAMVHASDPDVSVATVYNSLRLLVEAGAVLELRGLGSKTRFDANVGEHDHFSCRICGAVADIPRQQAPPRRLQGRGLARYRVEDMSSLVRGVCPRCRAAGGRAEPVSAARMRTV